MTAVVESETDRGTRGLSFVEACNEALDQLMAEDERVFLLGEDISDRTGGSFKITKGLTDKYSTDRVRDTPIAESAIVGAAIGAALGGMRPVCEIMIMDFIAVAMDQVVNHAAKLRYMSGGRTSVPITIRCAVSGGRGLAAQHSQSLEAWFAHVPGMKVVIPSTPYDAKGLLRACVQDDDPCLFMESMLVLFGGKSPVPEEPYSIPLGRADVKRPGRDVTVVTYGWMVREALDAAEAVAGDGPDVEVLDLRTLAPLDVASVLESVGRTKRAIVAHAAARSFGPGAEIAATIGHELFGELAAPVERLGARHAPNPAALNLEADLYPRADEIASTIRSMLRL